MKSGLILAAAVTLELELVSYVVSVVHAKKIVIKLQTTSTEEGRKGK